jgi:uridylate kinase
MVHSWRRVLLKVSGESLSGDGRSPIEPSMLAQLAEEIVELRRDHGVEVAVVVGGGNIWRGTFGTPMGIDPPTSDNMGMLATVMNALALQSAIEQLGQPVRVQSAITMAELAEPYIRRRAIRHLEKGRIVVFAAGTGNPFFTTDTAAALRAAEIDAEVVLKGTHSGVDGIYSADPRTDPSAVHLDRVSYMEVLERNLAAMDMTAITLCKERAIKVVVFDVATRGNIVRAWQGQIGTLVE